MSKKSTPEMIADALREIGALAIVLVPVDMIFAQGPIPWSVIVYVLAIGLSLLIFGIIIERIRI